MLAELEGTCPGPRALGAEFADQLERGIGLWVHLRAIGHAEVNRWIRTSGVYDGVLPSTGPSPSLRTTRLHLEISSGPISNDPAEIRFLQSIGANDALRTGSYSKTLTFTPSTTNP